MPRHLARVLEIALRLAREGREGTSVGAIFVLGDPVTLSPHLRQLVLNPLKGHPQSARSIHDPAFFDPARTCRDRRRVYCEPPWCGRFGGHLSRCPNRKRTPQPRVGRPARRSPGDHHGDQLDSCRHLRVVRDRAGVRRRPADPGTGMGPSRLAHLNKGQGDHGIRIWTNGKGSGFAAQSGFPDRCEQSLETARAVCRASR